ncbi:hypothetical protein M9458_024213, partial [Cirrhinus mrigala]
MSSNYFLCRHPTTLRAGLHTMSSRIGLRLQLMRDQMQQEEQRERQQQQAASMHYMQHRMPGPPAPSPAISAPTHFQAPMQVP